MGILKNDHCKNCKSRTKLLIRKENGKTGFWCAIAKQCPHSEQIEELSKLKINSSQKVPNQELRVFQDGGVI